MIRHSKILQTSQVDTPLGPMVAIADEQALYLLEFVDRPGLQRAVARLKSTLIAGHTQPISSIENELAQYFKGTLREFKTALSFLGSTFQRAVWEALAKIPYGQTCSYVELASAIGKPTACRAVAQANGANPFPLIIPCHRVINADGKLGGYSSGLMRKKWLLTHERKWTI